MRSGPTDEKSFSACIGETKEQIFCKSEKFVAPIYRTWTIEERKVVRLI